MKSRVKYSTESYIKLVTEIHNSKYNYSKVVYTKLHNKIVIGCPVHGEFIMEANDHKKGHGCNVCGNELTKLKISSTTELFTAKASEVHTKYYDYSKVIYISSKAKVIITCPIHGDFEQSPVKHLAGQGCSICNCKHAYSDFPTLLYYLKVKVKDVIAYKIGITSNSIKGRYDLKDLKNIEVLGEWHYNNGKDAYEKEQEILKEFKCDKYKGFPLLTSGNSELFNKDVLNLDYEKDN